MVDVDCYNIPRNISPMKVKPRWSTAKPKSRVKQAKKVNINELTGVVPSISSIKYGWMFTYSNVFFKTIDFATKATERYVNVEVQYERCWIFKWMFWLDFIAWPRLKVLYVGFPWFFSTRKPSRMWWYDVKINNIRSKTLILTVLKP